MSKTQIALRRNTAVSTVQVLDNAVIGMMQSECPVGAMLFSFDPLDPASESLVYAVDGTGTKEWLQHVEHPFAVEHWAAKKVAIAQDDGGDDVLAIRVTLIDPDGETLSFVSTGVAHSLDLIRTLRGDGPYVPPVQVVVLPVTTRRGFKTLKLRPVLHTKTKTK